MIKKNIGNYLEVIRNFGFYEIKMLHDEYRNINNFKYSQVYAMSFNESELLEVYLEKEIGGIKNDWDCIFFGKTNYDYGYFEYFSNNILVLNLEKITINDFSFLANYIFHLNDVQYYKPDDKFNKNILHDIQKDIHELLIASKYKNDIINTILSKSENYYKLNDTSEIDKISTIEWLYGLDIFIENMK